MKVKTIISFALGALVATVIGFFMDSGRPSGAPMPQPSESPAQTKLITSLRQDNERLQSQVTSMSGDLARLTEANAALMTKRVEPASSAPVIASQGPTLGLARWEVQQAALNNLRQIDVARKYFLENKGRTASSIHELVGRGSVIKAVRSVDGEDYSNLSMNPSEPLTVTTPDGIAVTFDPTGATTTRPEKPPEVVHFETLAAKMQVPINQAMTAYLAANPGKRPANEQALIPYFATPQLGADYTEYLEAKKAAGM